MPRNKSTEKLWQDEPNSMWYTNVRPVCSICANESDRVIEFKTTEKGNAIRVCQPYIEGRDCMQKAMTELFDNNPDIDYLLTRGIEYKPNSNDI